MRESLYVYALLDRRVRAKARRIHLVEMAGLFAAVERRAASPEMSEEALRRQHRIVLEFAAEAEAILPVRFGTLIDRDELERIVRSHGRRLRDALRTVRGREQMTVRVFGASAPAAPMAAPASGTEYLETRARLTRRRLTGIAATISKAVRPIVRAERVDSGQSGTHVTLNHLIERGEAGRYREIVESSVSTARRRSVVVSGPWPPFAFAPDLWSSDASTDTLSS